MYMAVDLLCYIQNPVHADSNWKYLIERARGIDGRLIDG